MDPVVQIAFWWLAFIATHMIGSSRRLRPRIVAAIGAGPFLGLYSLVAFATFVPLVTVFFRNKHAGPWLWEPIGRGSASRWGIYVLMAGALTLLVAGVLKPSPAGVAAGPATVAGVHRITRHPVFMAAALFGLIHLLPNGALGDVVFFGGFLAFGLIGCAHQDARKLAEGNADFAAFHAATPFLPFTGSDTLLGLREIPVWQYALGLGLTVALAWFHPNLFGP